MRYNREDIRDKLLEKCFPYYEKKAANSKLLRWSATVDSCNYKPEPLRPNYENSFQRRYLRQPILVESRRDPLKGFVRAASLGNLQSKQVESSRYSVEPVLLKPIVKLEERIVSRVHSAFDLRNPPMIRYESQHKISHPVNYLQAVRFSGPIRFNSKPLKRSDSPSCVANSDQTTQHPSSSTSADSSFRHFHQRRDHSVKYISDAPKAITILTPMTKNLKAPQKISMRGAQFRRQMKQDKEVKQTMNSTGNYGDFRSGNQQHKALPYRPFQERGILDGLLSQLCRPNCREDEPHEVRVPPNRKELMKTHSGFQRPSSKWYHQP